QPPRHVAELGVVLGLGARRQRLERHAADRARPGSALADLRMHRTGVDRARVRRWRRLCRRDVLRGTRHELLAALRVTEPILVVGVRGAAALRFAGHDVHAAHRVLLGRGGFRLVMVVGVQTTLPCYFLGAASLAPYALLDDDHALVHV